MAQSSFRAVTVDTFAVEPAHRVHTLQEVLQHDPWQPFYTTIGVVMHAEVDSRDNVRDRDNAPHVPSSLSWKAF